MKKLKTIDLDQMEDEEKFDLARQTDSNDTLSLLAEDALQQGESDYDILLQVVENRHASAELLNEVAGQISEWDHEDAQCALAKNPLVTEDNLIHLAEGPSPAPQREMLENPNLTPGVLDTLADGHIMEFVADHEMTRPDTLAKIAAHIEEYGDKEDDSYRDLRTSLIENPNTPPEISKCLAEEEDTEEAVAVAEDPETPTEVWAEMIFRKDYQEELSRYQPAALAENLDQDIFQVSEDFLRQTPTKEILDNAYFDDAFITADILLSAAADNLSLSVESFDEALSAIQNDGMHPSMAVGIYGEPMK